MKIISKFKDYYDHVAYMYGGGDPKIIYDRKPIKFIKDGDIYDTLNKVIWYKNNNFNIKSCIEK